MDIPPRPAALVAGIGLAAMAVLAPIAVFALLPASTGPAALLILLVAGLDIAVGVALWPILRPGGDLLALIAAALRVGYGAVFASAAGALAHGDAAQFQSIWDAALLLFGAHLLLAGLAMLRARALPTWVGALVAVSGLGYAFDSVVALVSPGLGVELGVVTFVGEVVLIVWLLGWAGRADRGEQLRAA